MAKKEKKSKGEKKKGSWKFTTFLVIGSLSMIVLTQMTYVLFVIGMLPSFVAFYVDRSPSHSLFHTVMPCNLAGVLPFVVELIAQGNDSGTMRMMLSDFTVLLIMYASAGLGWVLVLTAPHAAMLIIDGLNGRQISQLRKTQTSLTREWGDEVTRLQSD